MVKLSQKSSVDPAYQLAREWDVLFRKNYARFQTQIDKLTYSLQRKQRAYLALSYPKFYQAEIQKLEVLKGIQELGGVKKQELDAYKHIDPSINHHYNVVLGSGASWFSPTVLQVLGVGLLIGTAFLKKPLWSVSSFLILSPLVFKFVSYNNLLKTNEFLDFTLKVRSQKCLLEKLIIDNGDSLPSQDKKGKK